jgi:hypothetical protein
MGDISDRVPFLTDRIRTSQGGRFPATGPAAEHGVIRALTFDNASEGTPARRSATRGGTLKHASSFGQCRVGAHEQPP